MAQGRRRILSIVSPISPPPLPPARLLLHSRALLFLFLLHSRGALRFPSRFPSLPVRCVSSPFSPLLPASGSPPGSCGQVSGGALGPFIRAGARNLRFKPFPLPRVQLRLSLAMLRNEGSGVCPPRHCVCTHIFLHVLQVCLQHVIFCRCAVRARLLPACLVPSEQRLGMSSWSRGRRRDLGGSTS